MTFQPDKTYCPHCKKRLTLGNVKGYYQCNRCRKFFYISFTLFPDITEGMPLNAVKPKRKKK